MFLHTDVRPVLDSIQAPTLILQRTGDRHVRAEHHGMSPSGSRTRGWWNSTATTMSGSWATPIGC